MQRSIDIEDSEFTGDVISSPYMMSYCLLIDDISHFPIIRTGTDFIASPLILITLLMLEVILVILVFDLKIQCSVSTNATVNIM